MQNRTIQKLDPIRQLQPNIEGPEPLRFCIKSTDFTPGHFLLDSIDESNHQNSKTILVLSPTFIESEHGKWCYHEMRLAQMMLFDDNLEIVLLHGIPEKG